MTMTTRLPHALIRCALLAGVGFPVLCADPEPPAASGGTDVLPAVANSNEDGPAVRPILEDASTNAPTAAPTPDSGSFDRFRLVVDRNIFNSERRKPLPPGREPPPRIERPRTQTISLNGTISYEGKAFAFVSSSESQYRGVFSPGDTVAGWQVAAVNTRGVELKGDTDAFTVPVGSSLRREGTAPWELSSGVTSAGSGSSSKEQAGTPADSAAATAAAPAPAGDSGGGGGMSDILRRMMERRRQEQGQ